MKSRLQQLFTTTTLSFAIVTLLPPLKQLMSIGFPKLSMFAPSAQPPEIEIEVAPTPLPPTPSEILGEIGSQLRQLREQRQLSIDAISLRTQIQPRSIQAIEEGHIEMLPESVYVKGMIKRYANSLGLDGLEISQRVPTWDRESEMDFGQQTILQPTGFSTPQIKPLYLYLSYTLAIVGIGIGVSQLLDNAINPQHSTLHQPPLSTTLPIAAVRSTPNQSPGVAISIAVKQPTWAQIGIDGTTKFTGSLKVGQQFNWVATKQVTISTNNAGGLWFSRDRQPPKPLGKLGEKQQVTIKVGNY
jgi:cytoskeletal protein RodZ